MRKRLLFAFLLLSAGAFAWMDTAWQYRTPVAVSNGGGAQTDYQVSVTLNTAALVSAGKMRSDCGDLRFATSADAALSYWIESGCNTASTKAWVKDASVPAGSSTIYAYYGNPSATSTANGDSTFLFFDDFPGTSLDTATKWNVPGCSSYAVSGGSLQIRRQTCNTADANVYTKQQTFGIWTVARTKANIPWGATSGSYNVDYFGYSVNGQWGNQMAIIVGNGNWLHPSNLNNFNTGWAMAGVSGDSNQHIWEVRRTDTASYAYKDGALAAGPHTSQYPTTAGGVNFQNQISSGTDNFYADWVMVRKYAATEPTTSLQAEEQRPLAVLVGISPPGRTTYPNTNESFSLWVYNNQASPDSFALSCAGTCYYSENPVVTTAGQNKTVTVTITSAGVSGTTAYAITATSQANPANYANASASITVDAATWRDQWHDAYNSSYSYRTPITVSNNGSALTDYQVPINISNLVYNNTGLVGSWHFSEGAGTRFADSSGNGNDATYSGETLNNGMLTNFNFNASSGWVSGKYGAALQFDGVNDAATFSGLLNSPPSPLTIEIWVRPASKINSTTLPAASWIFSKETGTSFNQLILYFLPNDGRIEWRNEYGGSAYSVYSATNSWEANTWYHLTAVAGAGGMKLYVNGVLENQNLAATGMFASGTQYDARLSCARDGTRCFNGTMDEFRVYSRALSTSEISQVYQNNTFIRSGLAAYWRLDEGAGTTAQDTHHLVTPDNKNGTKSGNALSFDGTSDYSKAPDSASLDFSTGNFSIEGWIRASAAGAYIVNKYNNFGPNAGYFLSMDANGNLRGFISDSPNSVYVVSSALLNDSAWHHVAFTVNRGSPTGMKLYIDGSETAYSRQDSPVPVGSLDNAREFYMGATDNGGTPTGFFNGTIDEVRIYNRSLSASEIQALYGAGKLRLDYQDLRFVNSSLSQMPYWLESDNLAWARVPYLPNGTSTVYAYYGSPNSASASSITDTFVFGDEFRGSSVDPAKWGGDMAAASVSNGLMSVTGNGAQRAITSVPYMAPPVAVAFRVSLDITQADHFIGITNPANIAVNEIRWYAGGQNFAGGNAHVYTAASGATSNVLTDNAAAGYREYRIVWEPGRASWYRDGAQQANSPKTTNIPSVALPVIIRPYDSGKTWNFDYVYARNYASPEPAGALLLEESSNPAVLLGVSPSGKTTYPNYNETFSLWVKNNQTVSDTFTLSCAGTCSVSPSSLPLTAGQNGSATVTITSANVSGTTAYTITATSQANASNSAGISASITVDTTKWRDQWTDAYGNGFRYKTSIALTNNGSALADYQVGVTLDTASRIGLGRMRSDCGDVRFTNGTNEMPYWIEGGCNTSTTKIWARVPSIPAGDSTVYAYYGSPGAAGTGSGDATFELFDAFDGAALNTAKWAGDTGRASVGGGVMTFAAASSDGVLRSTVAFPPQSAMRIRNSIQSGSWSAFGFQIYPYASPYQRVLGYKDASYNSVVFQDATEVIVNTNWTIGSYTVKDIAWYDAGNIARWYEGGSEMQGSPYTNGANIPDESLVAVPARGAYQAHYVDWVLVRKYRSPEPAVLAGMEQSKGYSTLVRRCGLAQANATVTAYQASSIIGSCLSDGNGICALEIGAGTYDLLLRFADNSTAWKNGTVFG